MDKNSVTGLVLIAALLIGYTYFTAPSAEEVKEQQRIQDSIKTATALLDSSSTNAVKPEEITAFPQDTIADSLQLAVEQHLKNEKFGSLAAYASGIEEEIQVETDKMLITFSNKGAKITNIFLKDYKTYDQQPLQMFDPENQMFALRFEQEGKNINSEDLFFQSDAGTNIQLTGDEKKTFTFSAGNIVVSYIVSGNKFDIDYQLSRGAHSSGSAMLDWGSYGFGNEKHLETERQRCSVYFRYFNEKRDYLSEGVEDEEKVEERLNWIAFKQNFFSSILISETGFQSSEQSFMRSIPAEDSIHTTVYMASLDLGNTPTTNFKMYFGPNEYKTLNSYDVEKLDRVIDFGWSIFGMVNKYIVHTIFNWLDHTGMSYGIIILILTIIIKLMLSPLTYKNFVSSAKMRVIKPEIEALNKRMKDADPMKKQQETMALYRETGVNPMAGCLPMLLQMPILYAMFRFFPASIELRQESFLWADDLSAYDSILSLPFSIPFYGDHVSLFTLLMAASTFFYTHMNSSQMQMPQQEGMPNMKVMMYIFPFMMLFFFNNYSAGLSYYYLTANVLSITQMWVIKKYIIDEEKLLSKIESNKKKKGKQGKTRMQRRMEEMAKKRGIKLPE